jgi:hypothetical protein
MASASRISKLPASPPSSDKLLDDHRFRALLSDDDWGRLPLAIWRRFSKRYADGKTVVYVGEVVQAEFSRAGWWLAQLARLIGGPLPTGADCHVPAIVTVTEDAASGGQIWTRIYARRDGFPQVIHSAKRFCGPTGLEDMSGLASRWRRRFALMGKRCSFVAPATFSRSEQCGWPCRHG